MHAGNERIKLLKKLEDNSCFKKCLQLPGVATFGHYMGVVFDHVAGNFANYCYMPLVSQYNPWKQQAIHSLKELQGLKLTTLLHFQSNDRTVSNTFDWQAEQVLKSYNPDRTILLQSSDNYYYKVVRGHDPLFNGHTGPFSDLKEALAHYYSK